MSVRVVGWVLDHSAATGNDRLVLIAIADEADAAGANAFPSLERIAERARVSYATAVRCTKRLEAAGELLIRRPDTRGRGRHNRYVVTMGRDPGTLAGTLGWPAPDLDPSVAAEWSQPDTIPQPGDNLVDDAVDDDANSCTDPSETLQNATGKVAPGAPLPGYPYIDPRRRPPPPSPGPATDDADDLPAWPPATLDAIADARARMAAAAYRAATGDDPQPPHDEERAS